MKTHVIAYIITFYTFISCSPVIEEDPSIDGDYTLIAKVWQKIETVRLLGNTDIIDNYIGFIFVFNEDGSFNFSKRAAERLKTAEVGSWEIRNNNIILNLGLDDQTIIRYTNLTSNTITLKFIIENTFKGNVDIEFDLKI